LATTLVVLVLIDFEISLLESETVDDVVSFWEAREGGGRRNCGFTGAMDLAMSCSGVAVGCCWS